MHTPEAIFFVDGFPHAVGGVSCVAREPLGVNAQVNVGQLALAGVWRTREEPLEGWMTEHWVRYPSYPQGHRNCPLSRHGAASPQTLLVVPRWRV